MAQFENKTVMITGAGGGIASGIVKKFASEGARLALVDVKDDRMKTLVESLGDDVESLILTGNLNDPEDVDRIVHTIEDRFGTIDVLAHSVGGFAAGSPVHETDIQVFDTQFMLNTRILYITLGRVAKHMVEKGVKGSLIAMLARSGLSGSKNTAAYVASKAAAQRIVESMALELKDHDIRVNGVMPSTADTPANRNAMPNADASRWVTPEQLADAIAFLASDSAIAISGQSLGVYHKS